MDNTRKQVGPAGDLISWKCGSCEVFKPLDEYHRNKANKLTGLQRRCKTCMRASNRAYMKRTREANNTIKWLRVRIVKEHWEALVSLAQEYDETPATVARSIIINYLEQRVGRSAPAKLVHNDAATLLAAARRAVGIDG